VNPLSNFSSRKCFFAFKTEFNSGKTGTCVIHVTSTFSFHGKNVTLSPAIAITWKSLALSFAGILFVHSYQSNLCGPVACSPIALSQLLQKRAIPLLQYVATGMIFCGLVATS
jgi:hypothetical protein